LPYSQACFRDFQNNAFVGDEVDCRSFGQGRRLSWRESRQGGWRGETEGNLAREKIAERKAWKYDRKPFSFLAVAVKLPSKIGQKPPFCRSMRIFAVRHVGQFFEERLTGFLR